MAGVHRQDLPPARERQADLDHRRVGRAVRHHLDRGGGAEPPGVRFAIWARNEPKRPILLVCEEAHRYIPDKNAGAVPVGRKILSRIAKEGRKYGVSLGLITQRPSDLAEGVLSQCGTIISMRLNNDRDQAFVKAAMPEGARGFLDSIPALSNRECIICGEGVSIPIRVSLDDAGGTAPSGLGRSRAGATRGADSRKPVVIGAAL
jgi:DNA helicase HerA-like ATPase